jgi:DNA processing protein
MRDVPDALVRAALNAVAGAAAPVDAAAVRGVSARLRALGVAAVAPGDPDYPDALRALVRPPVVWFTRGATLPPPARAVAIVGARAASPYGRVMAARLAGDLARLGYAIVSGLARGIDAAAHEAALAAGGITIAVVPGGLDTIVPAHHRALAERIAATGTLASERASGPPRHPWEFVERNRLIAALAGATVVVEAAERSGALTTAAAARGLGRPVLAVPGDADREGAHGVLGLLRAGARPCTSAADVVRALAASCPATPRPARTRRARASRPDGPSRAQESADGPPPADRVHALLGATPEPLDALAARAALPPGELLARLLRLEWAGLVVRRPGARWSRAVGVAR